MNREAAALGVPVYTTYGGRLGGVDEELIRDGRLRPLTDPRALELEKREPDDVGARAARPADAARPAADRAPRLHGNDFGAMDASAGQQAYGLQEGEGEALGSSNSLVERSRRRSDADGRRVLASPSSSRRSDIATPMHGAAGRSRDLLRPRRCELHVLPRSVASESPRPRARSFTSRPVCRTPSRSTRRLRAALDLTTPDAGALLPQWSASLRRPGAAASRSRRRCDKIMSASDELHSRPSARPPGSASGCDAAEDGEQVVAVALELRRADARDRASSLSGCAARVERSPPSVALWKTT